MYNPNKNSNKIDPRTVTKPTYADPTVEDMYYEEIDGKHYVILAKRVTADMVRKHSCPFDSRQEAITFMYGLCSTTDTETRIKSKIASNSPVTPPKQEKKHTEENTSNKKPVFSFYD